MKGVEKLVAGSKKVLSSKLLRRLTALFLLIWTAVLVLPGLLVRLNLPLSDTVRAGIMLKSEVESINALRDVAKFPNGMSAEDVRAYSSEESKAATAMSGDGRNIYVLSTDPRLKYILANYHDRTHEKYSDNERGQMPMGKELYAHFSGTVARALIGIDEEQWDRYAVFLSMTDPNHSAAVEIYERDGSFNVVFLRRESTQALLGDSEVPYVTPLWQINQWSLPHELAHSWDFELPDRKHGGGNLGQKGSLTMEKADLIAESIADLTMALILLRETGNDDTLEYQVIPFRTRHPGDHIHATQYLLGKTYGGFTLADVSGKTDTQLSRMAISAIEKQVIADPQGVDDFMSDHEANLHKAYVVEVFHPEWLVKRWSVAKLANRQALENSLKNLVYQDQVNEGCPAFSTATLRHARHYRDQTVITALKRNQPLCAEGAQARAVSLRAFARDAGFDIDWDSSARRENNLLRIDTYYRTLTGASHIPDGGTRSDEP